MSTPAPLRRHTGHMSNIGKQRIAAVRTLEAMGYVFRDEWVAPAGMTTPATAEADAMHVLLVLRADDLRAHRGLAGGGGVQGNRRRY